MANEDSMKIIREWWNEEWYTKAIETFPEERKDIENIVGTPMGLWITLCFAFEAAYASVPPNESIIRRIYHFARWCLNQEQDNDARWDLPTCVICGFYEDIPRIPAARRDMPRWFTREEVVLMHQTFKYHLTDAEFEELLTLFPHSAHSRQLQRRAQNKRR